MSNTTALARQGLSLSTLDEMKAFALAAYHSGIIGKGDPKELVAKAVMSIQYGSELGLGPMQSIQGINIINGKPAMGSGLIASLVRSSGRYNYRVVVHTEKECKIDFFEEGKPCGSSEFSLKDAERAGLLRNPVWKSYPKNMLFARALSNGARWYCADVFSGSVYTVEELATTATVVPDAPNRLMNAIAEPTMEPVEDESQYPEPGSFEPEGDIV